jgi:membrane-bound lytic murein transglycosylase D
MCPVLESNGSFKVGVQTTVEYSRRGRLDMGRRGVSAKILIGVGLLLAGLVSGCGGRQGQPKVAVATSKIETAAPGTAPAEPDHFALERERAVALLVRDSRLLFERGGQLFVAGDLEAGRAYFRLAVDLLERSGYSFEEYPVLEQAALDLAGNIRRLEVMALMDVEEPPFPLGVELGEFLSPLDIIAALDLYAVEVDPALEHLVSEDLRQTPFDFPIIVNQEVLRFLDFYQGRGRKNMEEALRRSGLYLDRFRRIFAEEGLPQDLVYMAHVESLFKPRAYSRAHARGIWQFMAGTGRLYDLQVGWWLDERMDILKSTRGAARFLRDLKEEFGDWYLVLAAYNGGPGRVARVRRRHGDLDYWTMARRRLLPRETSNFVPSILAAMIIYRSPERYGFFVEKELPLEFDTVPLDYQVDLRVIADSIGVPVGALEEMNPELLRGVTPPDSEYQLKVPVGNGGLVAVKLAEIPPEQRLRLTHHKVRQGETLSKISARYGVPIRAIAEMNRLQNIHRLRLGQDLVIPLSDWRAVAAGSPAEPGGRGSHIVRRGDSLYKIARHYGVRVNDLFQWNNLSPGDVIHPGQEIRLSREAAR